MAVVALAATVSACLDEYAIIDFEDNCPTVAEVDQTDTDQDGMGDLCDPDDDNDLFDDPSDNCPTDFNAGQLDSDRDGLGNTCDPDDDNDGIPDADDNCPTVWNPDVGDLEGDSIGDICDPDDDNDSIFDVFDNCPVDFNPTQRDVDFDGGGDECDLDDDGDGFLDGSDNCPLVWNDQTDLDSPVAYQPSVFAMRPVPANQVFTADQVLSAPVDIGFPFTYFSAPVAELRVGRNGYVMFGSGADAGNSPQVLPWFLQPNGVVALYWEPLAPTPDQVTYEVRGTAPDRELVVMWNQVARVAGGATLIGQIVLHETSNTIELLCERCPGGTLHTQGIENPAGSLGGAVPGRNFTKFGLINDAVMATTDAPRDGIGDACDRCPRAYDPGQFDTDGDDLGDACESCPNVADVSLFDLDGDGLTPACDPDVDGDEVLDLDDNCPEIPNPAQADGDGNGVGDACQDSDGDGFMDAVDNCRDLPNVLQRDRDRDGAGDDCDDDDDNDLVPDLDDNCRLVANPDQADGDGNGVGDACEAVNFSSRFTSGEAAIEQCDDWNAFRESLTGGYGRVTIRGSADPVGVSCTGVNADLICEALANATSFQASCDGLVWSVGLGCGGAWPPPLVELNAGPPPCTCSGAGYTLRPCLGNSAWGSVGGNTCGGVTQTMEVICE